MSDLPDSTKLRSSWSLWLLRIWHLLRVLLFVPIILLGVVLALIGILLFEDWADELHCGPWREEITRVSADGTDVVLALDLLAPAVSPASMDYKLPLGAVSQPAVQEALSKLNVIASEYCVSVGTKYARVPLDDFSFDSLFVGNAYNRHLAMANRARHVHVHSCTYYGIFTARLVSARLERSFQCVGTD